MFVAPLITSSAKCTHMCEETYLVGRKETFCKRHYSEGIFPLVTVGDSSHLARERADWSGGAGDAAAIGRAQERESACQLGRLNGARRRGARPRASDRLEEEWRVGLGGGGSIGLPPSLLPSTTIHPCRRRRRDGAVAQNAHVVRFSHPPPPPPMSVRPSVSLSGEAIEVTNLALSGSVLPELRAGTPSLPPSHNPHILARPQHMRAWEDHCRRRRC